MADIQPCRKCKRPVQVAKTDIGTHVLLDLTAPVYRLVTNIHGKQFAERDREMFVTHESVCAREAGR